MNAIHGRRHLRALARHPAGAPRALARRRRRGARAPGGRFRPDPGGDGGHRAERLGGRRSRRHLGLRDDARVRRALAAREDRHARARRLSSCSTRATGAAPPTRCATCASSGAATTAGSDAGDAEVPVFATVARHWNDPGLDRLYQALRPRLVAAEAPRAAARRSRRLRSAAAAELIPAARSRYLAEIAESVRALPRRDRAAGRARRRRLGLARAARSGTRLRPGRGGRAAEAPLATARATRGARPRAAPRARGVAGATRALRGRRADLRGARARDRGREPRGDALAKRRLPKVALPRSESWGELARYLRRENLPGHFPFTAGVFPFKRESEDPTRMFAGEGTPERTNRRFHLLCAGQPRGAALDRLRQRRRSTAAIPTSGPTSTARSATRACRSAPSTTPRSSTRASISAPRDLGLDDDQRAGARCCSPSS